MLEVQYPYNAYIVALHNLGKFNGVFKIQYAFRKNTNPVVYQKEMIAESKREVEVPPEMVTINGEEKRTEYVTNKKAGTLVVAISIVSSLLFLCSICVCVFIYK